MILLKPKVLAEILDTKAADSSACCAIDERMLSAMAPAVSNRYNQLQTPANPSGANHELSKGRAHHRL
jgi:hypothetical protein